MKLMVGLDLGYEGNICIGGLPVVKKSLSKIREKLGYVFQDADSQLFMSHVYEDLAFAPRNYGLSESEVEKRVQKALEMVHIEHLKDKQIYKNVRWREKAGIYCNYTCHDARCHFNG